MQVTTEGFAEPGKSSTGDLNPLDKVTRPAVIVSIEATDFTSNNSVEVSVHYGHNRWVHDNLQVQRRTEAIARDLGLL